MDSYKNEKGEMVVIKDMDNFRLINAIAKYAAVEGKDSALVRALKNEAFNRLAITQESHAQEK